MATVGLRNLKFRKNIIKHFKYIICTLTHIDDGKTLKTELMIHSQKEYEFGQGRKNLGTSKSPMELDLAASYLILKITITQMHIRVLIKQFS